MLTEHLTPERMQFVTEPIGWREAIERVSAPLLADGDITRDYVDAMIETIADGGTYIHLGYGIALPHARPERGVLRTGLSALWVRPEVLLGDEPDHPISLFVCLAASDTTSHLNTMAALAGLLSDEQSRTALLAATTPAEATAVLTTGDTK